jgi:hypothetical protein
MWVPDLCKTECEWRFATYLSGRGLLYEYEPEVGGKRPDFRIDHSSGSIYCEVHEFAWKKGDRGGFINPYAAVRETINEKSEQGRGVKGQHPYVLVLCQGGLPASLDPEWVAGAMYGNVGVNIAVPVEDPTLPTGPPEMVFGDEGKMAYRKPGTEVHRLQNSRFSAVAVVRQFNPTQNIFDEAMRSATSTGQSIEDRLATGLRIGAELQEAGLFDPHEVVQRVAVVHNHFASIALPMEVFKDTGGLLAVRYLNGRPWRRVEVMDAQQFQVRPLAGLLRSLLPEHPRFRGSSQARTVSGHRLDGDPIRL